MIQCLVLRLSLLEVLASVWRDEDGALAVWAAAAQVFVANRVFAEALSTECCRK